MNDEQNDVDVDLLNDLLSNEDEEHPVVEQTSNKFKLNFSNGEKTPTTVDESSNLLLGQQDGKSDDDVDLLNDLLSNDDVENSRVASSRKRSEFNFMELECTETSKAYTQDVDAKPSSSVGIENFSDSSDEEDRRYFEEQRYSTDGREIKNLLKKYNLDDKRDSVPKSRVNVLTESLTKRTGTRLEDKNNCPPGTSKDVYRDPIFGLRMVKPVVSSSELKERMRGRSAITVSNIKAHIASPNVDNDWVIAGVLIKKSETKTSQKGSCYSIWKMSDLSESMKTVSVFLFSSAQKTFWKTILGSVVGILNPKVLESRDNYDEATISVDNPQKLMILGQSKDMGKCKSVKNDGESCNSIINLSHGEYCVYHVKKEYKKFSRRVEISSGNVGIAPFDDQRKRNKKSSGSKLLSSAGNLQSFTPILARRNDRLHSKDQQRLALLSGLTPVPSQTKSTNKTLETSKNKGVSVELTSCQVKKDFDRLNKLKSSDTSNCLRSFGGNPIPGNSQSETIDISEAITKKHIDKVKMNALKWIEEHGKIKPKDPNRIGLSKDERIKKGIKRERSTTEEEETARRKRNVIEKFQQMLKVKSSHADLIERSRDIEKDKYFDRLEMKEKMEEKMMNTFTVNCKAVECLKCKYRAFSSSELCKEQRHPIKLVDAVKRFFKCSDCQTRTVSLDRIPLHSCKKCNGSNWRRAAMLAEKNTIIPAANLSIRGGEDKYFGSTFNDANLNLLVPQT